MDAEKVTRKYTATGQPVYEVYCGNWECETRREEWVNRWGELEIGKRFDVVDGVDLIDGEVWYCPDCRPA